MRESVACEMPYPPLIARKEVLFNRVKLTPPIRFFENDTYPTSIRFLPFLTDRSIRSSMEEMFHLSNHVVRTLVANTGGVKREREMGNDGQSKAERR